MPATGGPQAQTPGTTSPAAPSPQAAAPATPQVPAPAAEAPAGTTAQGPNLSATPAGAGTDPGVFLPAAASSGMLEVAASRMALEKSSNAEVKAFAEQMIADHGKANEAVKALAAARNVALPAEMLATHKAEIDTLARLEGAAFDQAYAQRIGVQSHMNAVMLFEAASKDMPDAEVKALAERQLPTLREHLDNAQKLNQAVAAKS